MTAFEYILDGLEAELELERELGVRTVEFDRTLLAVSAAADAKTAGDSRRAPNVVASTRSNDRLAAAVPAAVRTGAAPVAAQAIPDFIFLHDRALSPKGVEMMAKIITALGKTVETAPVVIVPPLPKAKIYVVLGGLALRKFFPGTAGAPGQWVKSAEGADILVTYSPEYILRFGTVTPAVKKMKQDMWTSLKAVRQRALQ